jgi:energy-coupling factor transport system permease protein
LNSEPRSNNRGNFLLPEIRIILYIVFVIFLFFVTDLTIYLYVFAGITIFLFIIPFASLKRGWIPISLFLTFTFISNLLFQHGRIIYASGPLVITKEGLDLASMRTMRIFFMITGAKILTATTKIESLISAFGTILKPLNRLGLPVNEFFSTMGLTMKSLPVLKEQITNNYRERMQEEKITGLWNRARVISAFLMPLFIRSMNSPETIFEGKAKDERTD